MCSMPDFFSNALEYIIHGGKSNIATLNFGVE